MRRQTPLIYCHGIVPGRYLVTYPVFVVGDDPGSLTFSILVDEEERAVPAAVDALERPGSAPPALLGLPPRPTRARLPGLCDSGRRSLLDEEGIGTRESLHPGAHLVAHLGEVPPDGRPARQVLRLGPPALGFMVI
jgi:hypothetical protein